MGNFVPEKNGHKPERPIIPSVVCAIHYYLLGECAMARLAMALILFCDRETYELSAETRDYREREKWGCRHGGPGKRTREAKRNSSVPSLSTRRRETFLQNAPLMDALVKSYKSSWRYKSAPNARARVRARCAARDLSLSLPPAPTDKKFLLHDDNDPLGSVPKNQLRVHRRLSASQQLEFFYYSSHQ